MIERRLLPEALLANLKHPEKVLNHKKVAAVEHSENEVAVRCVDGTQYSCDILIGADGIRSKVRAEMSRLAGVKDEAEDEIKAEYMWYESLLPYSQTATKSITACMVYARQPLNWKKTASPSSIGFIVKAHAS